VRQTFGWVSRLIRDREFDLEHQTGFMWELE